MEVALHSGKSYAQLIGVAVDYLAFDGSNGLYDAGECGKARGKLLSMLPKGAIEARRKRFMEELSGERKVRFRRRSPTKEEHFVIECVAAAIMDVFHVDFSTVAMSKLPKGADRKLVDACMAFRLILAEKGRISWKSQSKLFGAVERSTIRESNKRARQLIEDKEQNPSFAENTAKAILSFYSYSNGLRALPECITTYNMKNDMYA